jgi:hypothetical protein
MEEGPVFGALTAENQNLYDLAGSVADITSVIDNFDKGTGLAPAFSFAD